MKAACGRRLVELLASRPGLEGPAPAGRRSAGIAATVAKEKALDPLAGDPPIAFRSSRVRMSSRSASSAGRGDADGGEFPAR